MSDLGKLFAEGGTARQLLIWGVLQQLLGALLGPETVALQQLAAEAFPDVVLSPAQAVDGAVKGAITADDAAKEAQQSGINRGRFDTLLAVAGEPPGLQFLLEAYRRGHIPLDGAGSDSVSVTQGIRESRLRDKWIATIKAMALSPISIADAVDAVVEGQITREEGERIAYENGISQESFAILVDTRGNPPSPVQLNALHKRGLIPLEGVGPAVTSVQQGIYEGATKDKWWRMLAALADYIPPARTITAMIREGSLTDAEGLNFLKQQGLSDSLAAAYVTSAHHQKTTAQRELTVSNIGTLYRDRFVDRAEATQLLALLNESAQTIAFRLDLWDFDALQAKVRTAVSKVRGLFVAHKIDETVASSTLDGLGIPASGRDEMLSVWKLEREANVQQLTAAEIADAVYYDLLTPEEGVARLVQLGWTPDDAVLRIGIRLHGKPPPAPKP